MNTPSAATRWLVTGIGQRINCCIGCGPTRREGTQRGYRPTTNPQPGDVVIRCGHCGRPTYWTA